jgi:hypothetical protein
MVKGSEIILCWMVKSGVGIHKRSFLRRSAFLPKEYFEISQIKPKWTII